MSTKSLPAVGVVSLGCPKNLVDTEVMLGHLKRAGHDIVPDARGPRRARQHVRLHRPREGGVGRGDPRAGRAQEAGRDRPGRRRGLHGPEVRAPSCRAEIPEVDSFLGLDELENAPAAAAGLPALPRFTRQAARDAALRRARPRGCSRGTAGTRTSRSARAATTPARSARSPRCAGLQRSRTIESLVAEARSLEPQGVSRARPHLPGHDPLRRGPRDGPRRGSRGWSRRSATRRPFRGSASSTPIRRRSTTRSSS